MSTDAELAQWIALHNSTESIEELLSSGIEPEALIAAGRLSSQDEEFDAEAFLASFLPMLQRPCRANDPQGDIF